VVRAPPGLPETRQVSVRRRIITGEGEIAMCRSIKTLFNFAPPATDDEIRAASLQFVRKLSGFTAPSKANEVAFNRAVEQTFAVAHRLVHSMTTHAPARNREEEARKAKERARERYGTMATGPSSRGN
jgi:hypothetical protein